MVQLVVDKVLEVLTSGYAFAMIWSLAGVIIASTESTSLNESS